MIPESISARDYFAAAALTAVISKTTPNLAAGITAKGREVDQVMAAAAFAIADAMMAERAKGAWL